MTTFPVAKLGDVPPGKMVGVEVEGERILVANVDGHLYAMRAVCNHMGGHLDRGILEGNVVICPLHRSKWDLTTGKLVQFPRPLPPEQTYLVTTADDQILIEK
jgi:nitrite reductase/ring-hydroxylating ferredoxin subunit